MDTGVPPSWCDAAWRDLGRSPQLSSRSIVLSHPGPKTAGSPAPSTSWSHSPTVPLCVAMFGLLLGKLRHRAGQGQPEAGPERVRLLPAAQRR